MTLYLNNKTALRFWCMAEHSIDELTTSSNVLEVLDADVSIRLIPEELLCILGSKQQVFHLLVGRAGQRTKSSRIVFHTRTKPYPKGAFRRYSPEILIVSPELCFFEMTNELPFLKLVEFGFFLCGTYTLNPNTEKPNDRLPLTTKRKLASFAKRMGTASGCRIAQRALSLILEGSASPRETKTTMLLCLPTKMGGYGFTWPILNHRIDFNESEQLLFGRPYVVLDLYWPEYHLGVEYDGGKGHTDEADVSRDRRKNSELNYKGIDVIRIDKEQLSSPYQVYVLAKKIARMMHIIIRRPTQLQLKNRRELFYTIMNKHVD